MLRFLTCGLVLMACVDVDDAADAAVDSAESDAGDAFQLDIELPDAPADDAALEDGEVDGGDPAPDPACADDGCLRAATFVGDFARAEVLPFLEPGVAIDNGYSVWIIRFYTDGAVALATVTVPYEVDMPSGGFHIVGNNHGTTGVEDACAFTSTIFGTGLAGLYGARGLIGVAPDYPGLGTEGVHPYLVAEVNGRAALDALRAAAQLAQHLAIPTSGRFATTGLSQGGFATLAAAAQHADYAPELDIRAFGAAAPASMWEEQWRAGIGFDGPHIFYHALLVYAWADHYGWDGPELWAPDFAASVDAIMRESCTFDISGNMLLEASVGDTRSAAFSEGLLAEYSSGEWDRYADFERHFATNRIGPYTQTAPLRIYQGDADMTVLEAGTAEMVQALRAGGVEVDYQVVPRGTHLDVAFGFVASAELRTQESIDWLKALLAAE